MPQNDLYFLDSYSVDSENIFSPSTLDLRFGSDPSRPSGNLVRKFTESV